MRRPILYTAIGAGAAVTAGLLWPSDRGRRRAARGLRDLARVLRYASNELDGLRYRVAGHEPDPDVPDDVIEDRVRSDLGLFLKRLDLPHVQVVVQDRHVELFGEVADEIDARLIESRVRHVAGVDAVESHLTPGLSKGTSRPSEGGTEVSHARRRLLDAVVAVGAPEELALPMVRATLTELLGRLQQGEVDDLLGHLPSDVRSLVATGRPGRAPSHVRTVDEFLGVVLADVRADVPAETLLPDLARAERWAAAILGALRVLVPEEVADVRAALPAPLKEYWDRSRAGV